MFSFAFKIRNLPSERWGEFSRSAQFYVMKIEDCLTTAAWTADAAERLSLLKIAQSYMLPDDYISKRERDDGRSGPVKHRQNNSASAQCQWGQH
jgi:hypothetical protein